MQFLIDTHIFLWWNLRSPKLSPAYFNILADPKNVIVVSSVVPWEIIIKHSLGKIKLPFEPREYFRQRLEMRAYTSLPISLRHSLNLASLPPHHKDPFDRILISQSQVEDIPLLTQDPVFQTYDVNIIDF